MESICGGWSDPSTCLVFGLFAISVDFAFVDGTRARPILIAPAGCARVQKWFAVLTPWLIAFLAVVLNWVSPTSDKLGLLRWVLGFTQSSSSCRKAARRGAFAPVRNEGIRSMVPFLHSSSENHSPCRLPDVLENGLRALRYFTSRSLYLLTFSDSSSTQFCSCKILNLLPTPVNSPITTCDLTFFRGNGILLNSPSLRQILEPAAYPGGNGRRFLRLKHI